MENPLQLKTQNSFIDSFVNQDVYGDSNIDRQRNVNNMSSVSLIVRDFPLETISVSSPTTDGINVVGITGNAFHK